MYGVRTYNDHVSLLKGDVSVPSRSWVVLFRRQRVRFGVHLLRTSTTQLLPRPSPRSPLLSSCWHCRSPPVSPSLSLRLSFPRAGRQGTLNRARYESRN